jgi:hypothetical protein
MECTTEGRTSRLASSLSGLSLPSMSTLKSAASTAASTAAAYMPRLTRRSCEDDDESRRSLRQAYREVDRDDDREGSAAGANGLGLASIAIGLTEIAAPEAVQSLLGLRDHPEHRGILRVLGIREILHGVSILVDKDDRSRQKVGVWSRVAGDMLDTALLGVAAEKTEKPMSFAAVSAAVLMIGALDMLSAARE